MTPASSLQQELDPLPAYLLRHKGRLVRPINRARKGIWGGNELLLAQSLQLWDLGT